MYYKNVEEDFPSYEFGTSRAAMMTWMKSPAGVATTIALIILIIFVIYWFFFRKDSSVVTASRYSYY